MHIIGRGGFGKVWKVKLKKTNEYFALKEMSKTKIIDRRSEASIMSEKTLLSKLNNPFIVNMYFAFQDYLNLYLVMDLLSGGDLRYQLGKKKKFTEKETKFFISNIILALEYIHCKNIIHRDIKPENLVLELNGYLRITDFGVAKINENDNSHETSGTPGYMAPEVILVQNHSFPSDFFALGVIGYEFMLGYRPYLGRSRKEIKELIIHKQARLNEGDIPFSWSLDAADFINKLLQKKPNKRLGYNGIKEIKSHIWMRDINWNALKRKELVAPFIPYSNRENFDKMYCEKNEDLGRATLARYKEYTESELFMDAFNGYTYADISYLKKIIKIKKNKEEINKTNIYNNNELKNEENNKEILIKTPSTKIRKNNSVFIDDKKSKLSKNNKKLNNSNSQKYLNFGINLFKISKDSRNKKINFIDINRKELLKKITGDDIKSKKKNKRINRKQKKNNEKKKDSYDKEKKESKAMKPSEKIHETKKNQTSNEINNNKKVNKNGLNKSNSMKMLNINIGGSMNYNLEKAKNKNKKNEIKGVDDGVVNNIKTVSKKVNMFNNNYNTKNQKTIKNYNKRIFSPKYIQKKDNKCNSVILNHHDKIKKNEAKQKDEIINKLNRDLKEKIIRQINQEKNNSNHNSEKKNINKENKNQNNFNNILIPNDFNIKEFEKENYNEPRSKVMLWIQRSHPINQSDIKNNKWNTMDSNDKVNIINKNINEKNNINKSNINDKNIFNQSPRSNLINDKNKNNKRKKLDINQIIKKSNNSKNRSLSQKKIKSFYKTNYYKSLIMDTNSIYKSKKIINKKQFKSTGNSKRNNYSKNKNTSQSVYFDKTTMDVKSLKSKSPKNTFLVFNTININLGESQKNTKRLKTPKAQVIRNINSSLKDAYLKNDFIFESMPFFSKKGNSNKDKKVNNNIIPKTTNNQKFFNFMKNYPHKSNNNSEIDYIKNI